MNQLIEAFKNLAQRWNCVSQSDRRRCVRRPFRQSQTLVFEELQPRVVLAATTAINDGDWFDASVWSDGVPTQDVRAIIGYGVEVQLDGTDHQAQELVVQGTLTVPEVANVDKSLTTRWVHINSNGVFQVGSAIDRYDEAKFTLNLTGNDKYASPTVEINIDGTQPSTRSLDQNDGFLMTALDGSLQLYGDEKLSFTKLEKTALPTETTITVRNVIERNFDQGEMIGDTFVTSPEDDGELNWEVGDQIAIASSSYDYAHEDVRTIVNVFDNGDGTTNLELDRGLDYRHFGEIEVYGATAAAGTTPATQTYSIDMRAEVALLSRNIKIKGLETEDTDVAFGDRANLEVEDRIRAKGVAAAEPLPEEQVANGVGGHLMFMPDSGQIVVDGVQLDGLGQASQKGRYPIHWHLGGNRNGDVLRNSSITNSNNRGVTIHGTSNLKIEGVVLHDIHGHGFFFEDAAETGNVLVGNLAMGIHKVGGNIFAFSKPGLEDPFVVDTHDNVLETGSRFVSSAAFWITNPDNTLVGNISAGASGTGFWYAIPRTVLGDSANKAEFDDIIPIFSEFGKFDYNTSHSTPVGLNFDRGSDIEDANFLGELRTTNHAANEYEPRTDPNDPSTVTSYVVKGFTNYKATDAAVYHRGKGETIFYDGLRIADSYNAAWAVSETGFSNNLYVGHSRGNADFSAQVGGPRLYDGAGLHTHSHFAGWSHENALMFQVEGSSFGPTMYHAFLGASFEDDQTYDNIRHAISDSSTQPGSHDLGQPHQWSKAVIDLDGTLTSGVNGGKGYSIVPNVDFLVDDGDVKPANWNAWLSEDIYARVRLENDNDGVTIFPDDNAGLPIIRFTASDGDSIDVMSGQNTGDSSWVQVAAKTDAEGDVEGTFEVEFLSNGIPSTNLVLNMSNQDGGRAALDADIQAKVDAARIVIKLVGLGNFSPEIGDEVFTETELRAARENVVYFRDGSGNLMLNTGIKNDQPKIKLIPGEPLQTPFATHKIKHGAVVEAQHFDRGADGIAFHDSDTSNSLGYYRFGTAVDATASKVGDIRDGEWLEYTADVEANFYRIGFRVRSAVPGGKINLLGALSNSAGYLTQIASVDVVDTQDEFSMLWVEKADLRAIGGETSVIRLQFEGEGFEVDSIHFEKPLQTAFQEHRITADLSTSTIELEDFDVGGQDIAYFDKSAGNNAGGFREDEDVDTNGDLVTNDIEEGEWLEYTTSIEAGSYDISLEKAWGRPNIGVRLLVGGSNGAAQLEELGVFEFVTGESETVTLTNIDLTPWAGAESVIRVEMLDSFFGLNRLRFVSLTQTAPTADIVDVGPDPRNLDAGLVTIDFSEDVTGVDIGDFSLLKDGSPVDISGVALTEVSPRKYTLDLSTVTATDGDYQLTLNHAGSEIEDGSGNTMATDAVDQFMVDTVGPQVESFVVNLGEVQRSRVTSLVVTFNEVVHGIDTSSFVLTNTTTGNRVVPVIATEVIEGKSIATLTFAGDGVIGGSLADGDYSLTILASNITDAANNLLDGDGNGISGDNAVDTFFRYFGDANGDRNVNVIDYFQFRSAFQGNGNLAFDYNGDGVVNVIDYFQFRRRFGKTLS